MADATATTRPWLYRGKVAHTRLAPCVHTFSYPAFFLCFPLSRKAELAGACFGINRFRLFSFHDRDHGDGSDSERWARRLLARESISADGEIWLQTLPRVLGFVFNPVSFWYCHDRDGHLRAVICEVNNTFGERHCYLLEDRTRGVIDMHSRLEARKIFHVSPFFPVQGEYHFRFLQNGNSRTLAINYLQGNTLMLKTAVAGTAGEFSDRSLLRLFFSLGWSTLLVVLRIHWQALRLWLKGVPFYRKPRPPLQETSR